jgi:Xaa-Pro aminopeptidase
MDDGILVAFGAANPDQDYLPYAQNASFRYLTGVTEAGAALIMVKLGDAVEEHLFVQPRDPSREVWEGVRLGTEGAQRVTGIETRTTEHFLPTLERLLQSHQALYTVIAPTPSTAGATLTREQQILTRLREQHPGTRLKPLLEPMQRLRATKTPAEMDLIRRATLISALAHREAMRSVRPGLNEFEIQGLVEYYFRRYGAEPTMLA